MYKYTGAIVDSHLHAHGGYHDVTSFCAGFEQLAQAVSYTKKNVVMVPQWDKEFISQNMLGILYKALYPGKVYAYAGFDYYMPDGVAPMDLEQQAKRFSAMGFDGIKMVELKPTVRRNLGNIWISDPAYAGMFSFLEEKQIPLLLHVGDPETFWDDQLAPAFAKENGWFYGNGSYPALAEFYADTERMLDAHPKLNVVLAHFFFLSNQLERAEAMLQKYPNVRFDITPGTEMYGNFSKMPERWSAFFTKYRDRILFGTDNGWYSLMPIPEKIDFAVNNVSVMRRFLETADSFTGYDMDLKGLDLPVETLSAIYFKNFEKMAGETPKPVDLQKALAYTEDMIHIFQGTSVPYYDRAFPQMMEVREALMDLIKQGGSGK